MRHRPPGGLFHRGNTTDTSLQQETKLTRRPRVTRRFVAGLPNLQDSTDLLGRREERRTRTSFGSSGPVRAPVASTASASSVFTAASGGGGGSGGAPTSSAAPLGTRRARKGRDFLYADGFVAGSATERLLQGLGWTGQTAAAALTPPQERRGVPQIDVTFSRSDTCTICVCFLFCCQ